jgi:hypothetical protein
MLRYTNFVEVTCPLFETNQLCGFPEIYDPGVVGWGGDWWFLHWLKNETGDKIAIVDEVLCLNPHDNTKASGSEIDKAQNLQSRILAWEQKKYNEKLNIDQRKFRTYASIRKIGVDYINGLLLGLVMHPIRLFTWLTANLNRIWQRLQFRSRSLFKSKH